MAIKVPGLPDGVECVRLGAAGAEEFTLVGESISKGARNGNNVVVTPAPGYEMRFDVRSNCYRATRVFDVKRTFTAVIVCEHEADMEYYEQISHMPVTLSITENPAPAPTETKA